MASPVLRSTTICSVVAARIAAGTGQSAETAAVASNRRCSELRLPEGKLRCRRAAVIVLPIMRRFGCGLAAKLTVLCEQRVKPANLPISMEHSMRAVMRTSLSFSSSPARDRPWRPRSAPPAPQRNPPAAPSPPSHSARAIFLERDRRRRPQLLRHGLARARSGRREGGQPMGPAERLHPGPGGRRRLRRRPALRRGHALHQECRRPARVLAGTVASASTSAARARAP